MGKLSSVKPETAVDGVDETTTLPSEAGVSIAVKGPVAILAILLVAISLRPGIVSIGPILPSIIQEFRLSHASAALLTSIPDVLMGLLALPTPWLARRFGRDPVILAAMILLCASIACRAFTSNVAGLLVTTGGVGAGIAIAGALIAGFIKARFPTKAALLMGAYATALSVGSTLSAALAGPIEQGTTAGWRAASGIWALLAILGIGGWLLIAVSERSHHAVVPTASLSAKLPVRNRTAWSIALFFACDNLLFYSLLSWTSPMYREAGVSPNVAGLILASFTAAFMFANPIFGSLSRSEDRRILLGVSTLLSCGGLVGTALAPGLAPFVFIPLCAFGLGGGFTLGMTLPLDNTQTVEEANVWNAFTLTVGYLIAAAGPLLVGYLRDFEGDFSSAMWFLVVISVAMLGLTPFLRPDQKR